MTPSFPLIDRLRTPRKAGRLLIAPSYRQGAFDSHAVDCPFPFAYQDAYAMTYVGWDGAGYRTGLALSENLLTWEKAGLLIDRGPRGSVTEYNVALTNILRENDLFGSGALRQINGMYVGSYHAYPNPGYEEGPAVIGLCFSPDLRKWDLGAPVLYPDPACAWEAGGLYKSWLVEHAGTYYLFYNAKNRTSGPWKEQTGVALSNDLVHWERSLANPLLRNGPYAAFDDTFASDPCVLRVEDTWVMFYFGLCSDGHARDGCAFSADLLQWGKSGEVLIDIGEPGSIDSTHAHKAGVISRAGQLYHFYCAVAPLAGGRAGEIEHSESRGITFACSQIP
jgi:predicted GH43/DUF377 family glycosyl hydrolase